MKKMFTLISLVLLASSAFAGNYKVDASHTFAWFKVSHLGVADTMGQFREAEGNFDLEAGTFSFTLKAASLDTNDAKRDEHLKGPDFFNAKQFPVIQFKSSKVESLGGNRYKVTGELALHGKKKEITVEITKTGEGADPWGNHRQGLEASFTLNRLDFGMNFMEDLIGHEVTIQFTTEGIKG